MTVTFTNIFTLTKGGMLAYLQDLDLHSHNLSNINTNAFKRTRSNFQEVLDQQQLAGSEIRNTQRFMEQGSMRTTGNPLDLAISGEGFFGVTLPNGETGYTRDGQFQINSEGQLVNNSGFSVVWDGEIPEEVYDVHVNPDGTVVVARDETWEEVGTIQLSRFSNPSGLESYGQNVFLETEVSGVAETGNASADSYGQILGNALEQSNVNMADEMTHLITLQRSFQLCVRSFQTTDQMLNQAIHVRR